MKLYHIFIVFFILFKFNLAEGTVPGKDLIRIRNAPSVIENFLDEFRIFQDFKRLAKDVYKEYGKLKSLVIKDFSKFALDLIGINTNSSKCVQDIIHVFKSVGKGGIWAIKMLDANGKLDSGVLEGNFKWIGEFNECRNITAPIVLNSTAGGFDGQYCTMGVSVHLGEQALPISVGVCLPDSCSVQEVSDEYHSILKALSRLPYFDKFQSVVNVTSLTCQPKSKPFTRATIAMICVFSFFGLLAFIGTLMTAIEYFFAKDTPELDVAIHDRTAKHNGVVNNGIVNNGLVNNGVGPHQEDNISDDIFLTDKTSSKLSAFYQRVKPFFNCFCVLTNGEKLLNTDSTEGQLLCLHGIRFLSMTWVILCHCYAFCFGYIRNLVEGMALVDSLPFEVIMNGFFSVDSFFLLSGFLLAYLYFQQCQKTDGKVPWVYFYIHRYLRLTPVYMMALGFSTTLIFYIGSGPFWPAHTVDEMCRDHWWTNLLYINNFYEKQCFGHAWYLANDMQFFVISPLFLISLWRWPKIGYSLLGLFSCVHLATNFGLTYHYKLIAGVTNIMDLAATTDGNAPFAKWFKYVYLKPWTRIGPYLVGIALGYIIYRRTLKEHKKLNKVTLTVGWIAAASTALACVYGLYHQHPSVLAASFYNALTRPLFGAALAWVIFVCLNGQGGPVNSILSYKFFIPLSRLTYCAYLIHPLIQYVYFENLKAPLEASHFVMVTLFLGILVITYALSLAVSLIFESPIIRLEKLIRTKFSSSK